MAIDGPATLDDVSSALPVVFVVGLAVCVFVYPLWSKHTRKKAMMALAAERHLDSFEWTLPRGFPDSVLDPLCEGWLGPRWSSVKNVISGEAGNDYLAAFDLWIGFGRGRYVLTIVARRSFNFQTQANLPPGYLYTTSGDWRIAVPEPGAFVRSRLVEPAAIERLWELLK